MTPYPKISPITICSKNHPEHAADAFSYEPEENSLEDLIQKDSRLQEVYRPDAFLLSVDGQEYRLESQLLKRTRDFIFIGKKSTVKLYVREETMDALSDYPINNSLFIQLLSGDTVVYGDEQREKQEHIMTHQIFKGTLMREPSDKTGFYCADLSGLLALYGDQLSKTRANNLLVTTAALRDYHYQKQKNNGFYHINAMNLPFQNIELYYLNTDGLEEENDASYHTENI